MIVVVSVAILAAVAYASYRDQAMRSARFDVRVEHMDALTRQEQFFLKDKEYVETLAEHDLLGTVGKRLLHAIHRCADAGVPKVELLHHASDTDGSLGG